MKLWLRLGGAGVVAAALLGGIAGPADAGPLVTTWQYRINNGFESFVPVPGVVGLSANPDLGFPTRLEWPLGSSARSSLEVDSVQTGTDLETDGAQIAGGTLTHNNAPVPTSLENQFLTSGRLRVRVDLTSADGTTDEQVSVETFFDFLFQETRNDDSCGFPSASQCDDLFVLVGTGGLSQQFRFDGRTYTLIFGSEQLAALDPSACQQAGIGPACTGFATPENASTDFRTFVRIVGSAVSVSEPGILALVAAGLVAVGVFRRRSIGG